MTEQRKKNVSFWLLWIFIVSILIRFYLAFRTGGINDFPDEPFYWLDSKSLFLNEPFYFRGVAWVEEDILYQFIISIAHILKDFNRVYCAILLINVVLMSSAVFPLYLLSYEVLKEQKSALFVAAIGILVPEMYYTSKIVQENLFYPYVIWVFYLFYRFLLKDKFSIKRVTFFSVFLGISFYIKTSSGCCLVAALCLFYFIQMLFASGVKQKMKSIVCMLIPLIVSCAVDFLTAWIWPITSNFSIVSHAVYIIQYIYNLIAVNRVYFYSMLVFILAFGAFIVLKVKIRYNILNKLKRNFENSAVKTKIIIFVLGLTGFLIAGYRSNYIQLCATYMVYMCVFFGIMPLILTSAYMDLLEEKERDFFAFGVLLWLILVIAVCFFVFNINTEIRQGTVRLHYRFIFYSFIPFLILFLKVFKLVEGNGLRRRYGIINIVALGLILVSLAGSTWSMIDAPSFASLEKIFSTQSGKIVFKVVLVLALLAGYWMVRKKYVKELYTCVFLLMTLFFLFNSFEIYRKNVAENRNQGLAVTVRDGRRLEKYFEDKSDVGSVDDVLIAPSVISSFGVLELCINVPYRVCFWKDLLLLGIQNNWDIPFNMLNFYLDGDGQYRLSQYYVQEYDAPKYVISQGPLSLLGYHKENIDLEEYYLWVRN